MKNLIFNMNGALDDTLTLQVPEGIIPFPEVTTPIYPLSGVTFLGWGLTPTDVPYTGATINITTNITFYALWDGVNTDGVEFRYKPNGANGTVYNETHDRGEMVVLPLSTSFTHPLGYTFIGWGLKPDDIYPTAQVLANQDRTLYALWKDNSGGGGGGTGGGSTGYGTLTGNYVTVTDCERAAKLPITDQGYVLLGDTYIPNTTNGYYYTMRDLQLNYNWSKVKEFSCYELPPAFKLAHPGDPAGYLLKVIGSSVDNPKAYYDNGLCLATQLKPFSQVVPIGRPGKKFIMWSKQQQEEDAINLEETPARLKHEVWPIYRKDDNPQFKLVIDGNNGEGEELVYDPLVNEVYFVDPYISLLFTPPKAGMRFVGLATKPNGVPKVCQEILINKDTTLYCIWK